eukprot:4128597-Prymnesium_polylepis.1
MRTTVPVRYALGTVTNDGNGPQTESAPLCLIVMYVNMLAYSMYCREIVIFATSKITYSSLEEVKAIGIIFGSLAICVRISSFRVLTTALVPSNAMDA